jgi:hypothetical protein
MGAREKGKFLPAAFFGFTAAPNEHGLHPQPTAATTGGSNTAKDVPDLYPSLPRHSSFHPVLEEG